MNMDVTDKDSTIYKALRYSEILGENLFEILQLEGKDFDDFVFCCGQRIDEEIRRRMETGIITPFKCLKWTAVGESEENFWITDEVPFQ